MLILIAPDSFKSSATAAEAAIALAAGAHRVLPDADVALYPMADGGEGTIAALTTSGAVRVAEVAVTDAIGRPRTARYGMDSVGTAIIEVAEASGLPHVAGHLAPLTASTWGTGLVIADALAHGAREILLCLGGSATTDGGAGILRALGARALGANGEVDDGGAALAHIGQIDLAGLLPAARLARWRLACDVDNPLTGENGAAAVFGPQKGAGPADVAKLDAALGHWARLLNRDVGPLDEASPGVGAAGGTPAALIAAFDAELVPGARLVADAIGLTARIPEADLLITGEGSFDSQSLDGKVVGTLAQLASGAGVPVLVVAGAAKAGRETAARAGIVGARSIADGPRALAELMAKPAPLIEAAAADMLATFAAGLAAQGPELGRPGL
ncbi:MAG: glycerate kinase [Bifidobacteriaceae bacterium]|jgi:glycerate kinase|nr:glycerate kinase [Bifidobacteriaceae bacterium]